ncbi:MAG TPA: magnesium-translocating P-type ATPase [Longilinea sp.]|nr:magnesium-translocating P-type ATPase [Longilinea sp.]
MNSILLPHQRPVEPHESTAPETYWNRTPQQLLDELHASPDGLQADDADQRLKQYGLNAIRAQQQATWFSLLLEQFKSPLVLILIFAAIVSGTVGEWTDAIIVLAIVLGSTLLGFVQEYSASNAVQKLQSQVTIKSSVLRAGQPQTIPSNQVVPGDVVLLSAGSLIPADGVVLEAKDFFVNQAVLTGETFPVEKMIPSVAANASLADRTNCVFMGTSVSSGTAKALIVETGSATVFGQIAGKLSLRPPETEFERGIRRFGYLLTQTMLVIVVIVLAINIFLAKPPIDSLLFALALAVGLTPELLPAIIGINLSLGAQRMAKRGVIVRRLNAIENFGSMDVLCTDKTGTLTEGVVRLDGALDPQGQASPAVLRFTYLNSHFQTGLNNPLDEAIIASAQEAKVDISTEKKVDEIPYDFVRKCLSVVTADSAGSHTLIMKGAFENVLGLCSHVQSGGSILALNDAQRAALEQRYSDWSAQGYRVLGVATKPVTAQPGPYSTKDESDLTFTGFLLFFDPPKADVAQVIKDLTALGVRLKIITGDNQKVARHVADAVGLPVEKILTGSELDDLRDEALWHTADHTTLFAEVDPNQKERIISALRKTGHVVGYMGDGINDAPALHAADVALSVDTAVDVAKDAAEFVLLRKDLDILREGIDEGRKTFANTLKYILITISGSFGNMFSMAGASLFLSFLPMLAPQILLENFMSDIPNMAIAGDAVDAELVDRPRRWNTNFIRNYMILFGLVSSIFDFLTFGTLLFLFQATPDQFRTGWFVESLLTELVITIIIRTRHVFFRSRPGSLLLTLTVVFAVVALAIPYLPYISVFGFVPLPAPLLLAMVGLTAMYVVAVEIAKKYFFSRPANANA